MATTGSTARKKVPTRAAKGRVRVASVPKGAPTIADLRRIARSIVTATAVMDEKRLMSLYADSVESEEAGQNPSYGIEAIKQKGERWRKRVSDQRWHARNLWVDGQTIIVEWEAQLTLKPGGKRVILREVAIHEIRAGKIVRERFYYDPSILR
jgi:ketosteroid isomerase-like protein